MKIGLLKESGENKQIEFNDYENKHALATLQKLVNGNLDFLPLGSLIKALPEDLKNVTLVINSESKSSKGFKPNILVEEEVLLGNIAFIRVDEKGKAIGLTEKQIKLLPDFMDKLILPQELKLAFGCC